MPFKLDAARRATTRDDAVVACGAANTLVRTESGWHATNTDASAVRTCIGRALCDSDRKLADVVAVVVGTGGAARAALHGLRGARLAVAGRDAEKRDELAQTFSAESIPMEDLADVPHDVVVNTTPLGSRAHPGELSVPADALRPGSIVLDAVYRPSATPLVRAARALGAHAIEGREWFLEQALAQFRAFTGADAPAEAMRDELDRLLAEDAP
jgi:shikimate dehydrogenase